jgi:hypothetical protein
MDEMTKKVREVTEFLKDEYKKKKGTVTRNLPHVLPPRQPLKALVGAVNKILELWEFYESVQRSNHTLRQLKKLPKVKTGPGVYHGSMEEVWQAVDRHAPR